MVKAVVHEAQGGEHRFPAGPRALLRSFQSGRNNRLGRMKKGWRLSNWYGGACNSQGCGAPKPRGRGLIPSLAKSTFKLVSEWKKRIRKL